MEQKLIPMFLAPLTPSFGVVLIVIGLYSIMINAAEAARKNHRRAEKTASIGGWLYIGGGAAVMIRALF